MQRYQREKKAIVRMGKVVRKLFHSVRSAVPLQKQ